MNSRREFLRISSTTVIALAATGLLDPRSLFAASTPAPLLGIGHAAGFPFDGAPTRLGYASSLLASDPGFLSHGARLSVAGFGRSEKHANDPGGILFSPVFPVLSRTPENYPRFQAWSYNGSSCAGAISFTMPVTAANGLQFVVSRLEPKSDKRRAAANAVVIAPPESRVSLALNSGGDAKLQGGVYVFAFREDATDREPAWPNYILKNNGGVLSVPNLDVSHMILVVDYERA